MSEHSDRYNSLQLEDRQMLNALMVEAEIRFIELEKKRMLADFRKNVRVINDRVKNMRRHLETLP
ncbi:hypothetical protein [Pseudomonas fragi]|uniref:Uncharacterized protein n=1 Tax=Pseudomonas fragi TaxID=296 RepID=A0A9Q5AYI0_PSEFR|nr:hypothetical protein [Pseudomonas fragi]NNB48925.1 hypothetical protein [Pseudomonas fragi]PAA41365.1 hypothetical protein CJU80_10925 [Pseudomonas fragi]